MSHAGDNKERQTEQDKHNDKDKTRKGKTRRKNKTKTKASQRQHEGFEGEGGDAAQLTVYRRLWVTIYSSQRQSKNEQSKAKQRQKWCKGKVSCRQHIAPHRNRTQCKDKTHTRQSGHKTRQDIDTDNIKASKAKGEMLPSLPLTTPGPKWPNGNRVHPPLRPSNARPFFASLFLIVLY